MVGAISTVIVSLLQFGGWPTGERHNLSCLLFGRHRLQAKAGEREQIRQSGHRFSPYCCALGGPLRLPLRLVTNAQKAIPQTTPTANAKSQPMSNMPEIYTGLGRPVTPG